MSGNPLQKYFRQPKIFVKLPTGGAFNKPGVIDGNTENLPVYAMTGMDEIVVKTPDALLSGEATMRLIQSCCPAIKDAWQLCTLDVDVILVAIRIATYGNEMPVSHTCSKCGSENDYDIPLSTILEHYASRRFESKLHVGELTIRLRPLSYKQLSTFGIKNFEIQKKMLQIETITDPEEQQKTLANLYTELSVLQNEIYFESIDSVEVDNNIVTEREFIKEWLSNAEKEVYEALRSITEKNKTEWATPTQSVTCESCGNVDSASIDLDQSNFFVNA